MAHEIDFSALAEIVGSLYKEAAIILPGPPIQIFAQRAAPTISLKALKQTKGKFYYECKTLTGGYMQIGWADAEFSPATEEGKGAGDDIHSWAYDGYRCLKWHANKKEAFGRKWKAGDVIGIAVDLEAPASISFSLNGDWEGMGIAFEDIKAKGGIYPCVTLLRGMRVELNIGTSDNPFAYLPPSSYFSHLTVTKETKTPEKDTTRFAGAANIIEMGMSQYAFTVSSPGEIMVNVMGRGLDYEAKKNAMIHAGYEATMTRWERKKDEILLNTQGMNLTNNEIHALICYTLEEPPVYRYFNNDTRQGYTGDGHDFPIISHLLREGCRKILATQRQDSSLRVVYRGVGLKFSSKVGETIRFGSFTSTTGKLSVSEAFQEGDDGTLFVIKTKIGASISMLSEFPNEDEVLIPPYEIFRIEKIEEGTPLKIHVESTIDNDLVDKYASTGAIGWNK